MLSPSGKQLAIEWSSMKDVDESVSVKEAKDVPDVWYISRSKGSRVCSIPGFCDADPEYPDAGDDEVIRAG